MIPISQCLQHGWLYYIPPVASNQLHLFIHTSMLSSSISVRANIVCYNHKSDGRSNYPEGVGVVRFLPPDPFFFVRITVIGSGVRDLGGMSG
jgi:hypothetical protein